MKKEDIKELIEFFNQMDMNKIKIKDGDFEVELEKFADCCELPAPTPVVQAPAPAPVMNEIEAEFDCTITEMLVADGQPVEFGMALFGVEKN